LNPLPYTGDIKMKLELSIPGNSSQKLLFSNINSSNSNHFYLLMTYHKSRKGGFSYPVTTDECNKALKRENKNYLYETY